MVQLRRTVRATTKMVLSATPKILGRRISPVDLAKSAIVFAPHPDDETLGCGGTICRKRWAGADVTVVFLTDGARSHPHCAPSVLRQMREQEALCATRRLGVQESDVVFLAYPDTVLLRHADAATEDIVHILGERQPAQVFIPHRHDHATDHVATSNIVKAALQRHSNAATVYEYPVWFWEHWPWLGASESGISRRRFAARSLRANTETLLDLHWYVPIGEAMECKWNALQAYRSQMTRLSSAWTILADVANGDFLARFLQSTETFARRNIRPRGQ